MFEKNPDHSSKTHRPDSQWPMESNMAIHIILHWRGFPPKVDTSLFILLQYFKFRLGLLNKLQAKTKNQPRFKNSIINSLKFCLNTLRPQHFSATWLNFGLITGQRSQKCHASKRLISTKGLKSRRKSSLQDGHKILYRILGYLKSRFLDRFSELSVILI